MDAQSSQKKDPYTKPLLHTHEPLRNITAGAPGGGEPTPATPTPL